MICRIRWTKSDASERTASRWRGKCCDDERQKAGSRLWSCHYLRIIILILSRLSRDSPALSAASSGPRNDGCWDSLITNKKLDKEIVLPPIKSELIVNLGASSLLEDTNFLFYKNDASYRCSIYHQEASSPHPGARLRQDVMQRNEFSSARETLLCRMHRN